MLVPGDGGTSNSLFALSKWLPRIVTLEPPHAVPAPSNSMQE